MNTAFTPQERMDAAFDNYIELSKILQVDMNALLEDESDSQHWRRNFIRTSVSLIEGYAHCLREMCKVSSFEYIAPELSRTELKVLQSEKEFKANERIRLTLRLAYKLFQLELAPNFDGNEWHRAQQVLTKRHLLMHPKTPADLEVPEDLWNELRDGVAWMMEQLFNFFSLLKQKHGG